MESAAPTFFSSCFTCSTARLPSFPLSGGFSSTGLNTDSFFSVTSVTAAVLDPIVFTVVSKLSLCATSAASASMKASSSRSYSPLSVSFTVSFAVICASVWAISASMEERTSSAVSVMFLKSAVFCFRRVAASSSAFPTNSTIPCWNSWRSSTVSTRECWRPLESRFLTEISSMTCSAIAASSSSIFTCTGSFSTFAAFFSPFTAFPLASFPLAAFGATAIFLAGAAAAFFIPGFGIFSAGSLVLFSTTDLYSPGVYSSTDFLSVG
mmetsp:Transcript_16688/g.41288  ORF Transcript_16688/g.41288 Transcript_16688/m.41288 type:complete len:266 (+) Transcript_16688:2296-3093(+)